jgi:hypothetical protein
MVRIANPVRAVRTTRSAPKRRMKVLLNWALPMNATAFEAKTML